MVHLGGKWNKKDTQEQNRSKNLPKVKDSQLQRIGEKGGKGDGKG